MKLASHLSIIFAIAMLATSAPASATTERDPCELMLQLVTPWQLPSPPRYVIRPDPSFYEEIRDPYFRDVISARERRAGSSDWNRRRRRALSEKHGIDPNAPIVLELLDRETYHYWRKALPECSLKCLDDTVSLSSSDGLEGSSLSDLLQIVSRNKPLYGMFENGSNLQSLSFLLRRDPESYDAYRVNSVVEAAILRFIPPEAIRALFRSIDFEQLFSSPDSFDLNMVIDLVLGLRHSADIADRAVKDRLFNAPDVEGGYVPNPLWGTPSGARGIQTHYSTLFRIFKSLGLRNGQTFVDVGSGFGRVLRFLELMGFELNGIGYDIAPEKVALSKEVDARLGFKHSRYFQQDLTDPDFSLPAADYYFLFDPTTDEVRKKVISDIRKVALRKKRSFKIIAISGWSTEILKDFATQDWLVEVGAFTSGSRYTGKIFLHQD